MECGDMKKKSLVRITESRLENFKNVAYGDIKYVYYSNAEYRAEIKGSDINGIYGQNGSGKTAIIESLDIVQHVMSGKNISYNSYAGMFDDKKAVKITNIFYIECENRKYKAEYELELKRIVKEKKIQISSESITYWQRGSAWKTRRRVSFSNPYYDTQSILENAQAEIISDDEKIIKKIRFFKSIQNLAVMCAQQNISLFFNDVINKTYTAKEKNDEEIAFSDVAQSLFEFANMRLQVVKVNQLGANYSNSFIPVNVHVESDNEIMQGCIPLFVNGRGEFPEIIFNRLKDIVKAINVAIKSIIPNLSIEIIKINEEINKDGIKIIQVEVYSRRDENRFLIKYESEGIKRIISLLNYLIYLYNNPGVCLVVDELDAGIFEYLLGELVGVLAQEAKGQLIFTSHNLRIMEKLDKKNIICSTINPLDRYISLKGIEKTNNKRDFYIRTLVLGGQKEKLYDDTELQDIGYAFKKAGNPGSKNADLNFSADFLDLLNQYEQ